jgi:TatD DNase family protein
MPADSRTETSSPKNSTLAGCAFVDTHCHLDAFDEPARYAAEAARAGVQIIAVTNLPSRYEKLRLRLPFMQNVRVALGAHPLESRRMNEAEWRVFAASVSNADDIGEIGLDFSGGADRLVQERILSRVLSMLHDRPRFLTLHSRRAVRCVLKHLAEAGTSGAVLHWFTGSLAEVDAALADGHFFSINTAMIRSPKGQAMLRLCPRDHVLAETDGPYARHRGKPAMPIDVRDVYKAIAHAWGADVPETQTQLERNLKSARIGANKPLSLFRGQQDCSISKPLHDAGS